MGSLSACHCRFRSLTKVSSRVPQGFLPPLLLGSILSPQERPRFEKCIREMIIDARSSSSEQTCVYKVRCDGEASTGHFTDLSDDLKDAWPYGEEIYKSLLMSHIVMLEMSGVPTQVGGHCHGYGTHAHDASGQRQLSRHRNRHVATTE